MRHTSTCILLAFLFFVFPITAHAWKISAGTVTMNDPTVTSGYQTVSFTGSFFDATPVVFVLAKNLESEPRAVRIRNVTTSGFEIIQVRPSVCGGCTDAGNFATPTISWIAIEPGRHALPGGDFIEVGTINTTTSQSKLGGTEGWDTVNFSSIFSTSSIAMVGQVQTDNNGVSTTGGQSNPFITTAIRNANASSFEIALELSEVSAAPPGSAETIGWLAAPDGMTDTLIDTGSSSVLIEAILSADNITNNCNVDNNFSNTYSSNPLVVASKNRLDGGDGGWMRECLIGTGAVRLKVQEDEGSDTDVNHTTESAGIFVVERPFDAEIVTPEAIAEWRMDEFNWNGSVGEVTDETGNGYDGTAVNGAITDDTTPAIASSPGTCSYGVFDDAGGASGDYIELPGFPNLNTDFTITAWIRTSDNTRAGQRIFADDENNSGGFAISLGDGGTGSIRFFSRNVNNIILDTGNLVANNTWYFVAGVADIANSQRHLYVYDTSGTLVGSATDSFTGTWGTDAGIASIGGETNSGETDNRFFGNIDEVRVYDTVLNTTEISNILNETHLCPSNLYFEVDSVTLNDTNTTPAFTSVNFRQTYPSAPLVFALPTNSDTDPAALRVRNVTTTGFEIAQVEPETQDGRQNAMTVDYIAIMPGVNILPDGRTVEAGTHTTNSVQHGSGVPGGETWDTVNFTSTFTSPSVLLQIQGQANEYNNPPNTTSRPWLTASIQNVGNTSFQTALERSEVNDGNPATVNADETIAYLAIDGDVQGSFVAEGKTVLYETIISADNIAGWDNENCSANIGESISFINSYSSTPLAIAHTRRHDGGDGGWIRRCSIDATQIGLAYDEDQFNDTERNHTDEQASIMVFSEEFCYPTCVGTTVNHYDIDFSSGSGITCLPVEVTITAKDAGDATVSHSSDTTIDFNVTTNLGQWGTPSAGTGVFTDPTPGTPDNGDAQYEFPSGESSVTIPLNYTVLTGGSSDTFELNITTSPNETTGIADANDDPEIDFFLTGIIFNNVTDANNTISTQVSGKPSNTGYNAKTINLQVVRATDDDSSVCQSIFGPGDIVNIDLGAECKTPASCAGRELNIDNINPALPVNGVDIATSDDDTNPATVAGFEPGGVDLQFGASSAAEIVLTYPDAGEIQLHTRYELLLDDGTPSGNYATGISNDFVVRPFGFSFETIEELDSTANPAATDATGSRFVKAGEDFRVTVTAYNWGNSDDDGSSCDLLIEPGCVADDGIPDTNADLSDNNGGGGNEVTPNFQGAGAIDVTLSASAPFSPATGTLGAIEDSATLAAPVLLSAGFTSGSATISTVYYDEVGTVTLVADATDYLGSGEDITGRSSNNVANLNNGSVGRFVPDRFTLADNSPSLINTCDTGGFTYMDETFSYDTAPQITLTAVNTYGDITDNYGDGGTAATDFWKLPTALARDYDDNGVNNGSNFISATLAGVTVSGDDNFDGVGVLALNNAIGDRDTFMFDRSTIDLSSGDGEPFTASIDLLIQVTAGSLTDTDGVCYDGDSDGNCETDGSDDYLAITDSGGVPLSLAELRFGRFTIGTAVGTELLPLNPVLRTEYLSGGSFVINADDSCTFDNSSDTFDLQDHLRLSNASTGGGTLQAGNSAMTIGGGTTSITTFNTPVVAGDTETEFSSPGQGNVGYVDILGNLACNDATIACVGTTTYEHLLYDWDDDGAFDNEPAGRVDFGLYEGPKEYIYIREPW